jgi:hypothetical protein
VVLAVLRQLGAIRPEEFAALGGDELQRVTNRRGLNVGEARTSLSLALAI